MPRRRPRFLGALAHRAAQQVLNDRGLMAKLDRARPLGRGLDYAAFAMSTEDGSNVDLHVVARVPHDPTTQAQEERAHREVQVLNHLHREPRPFRVPEVLGLVKLEERLIMVQKACYGVALPLWSGGQPEPWSVIGSTAASIHRVDMTGWDNGVAGPERGQREHLLDRIEVVSRDARPVFDEALEFVRSHLPVDRPGLLVHGDLLPQNLLLDVRGDDPPVALDWTYATRGDPAHDLAIVTRGLRRPFRVAGGHRRLLEAYNASSERVVGLLEVRLHELLLRIGLHAQLLERQASEAECEQEARFVAGLLDRARRAAT